MRKAVVALAAMGALYSMPAVAQEAASMGLNADIGISSAYLFRGLNLFQSDGQSDQHVLLAPSITYTVPGLPMQVGYWGAFQLTGDNKSALVDAGVGAEQDLWVSYAHCLGPGLTLTGLLTAYYYPLSDDKVAGTANALYLEPSVGLAWAGALDLSMKVTYMHGVQEAVELGRYVYFNPAAGKTLTLTENVALSGSLSAGYKLFNDSSVESNQWDVAATLALPISLPHGVYVKPSASVVWTNLPAKTLGDEIGYAGSVNVGVNL